MATSRIATLSATIALNTQAIDEYCTRKKIPSPSFDPENTTGLSTSRELLVYRQAVLTATDELHALVQGPVDNLIRQPFNSWISLQAITKFGLASSIPDGQVETTFSEIATACRLPEAYVRRLLRHAMTFRIFHEPREGVVRHTAASKTLAETPLLQQYIGMVAEELWPAATKAVEALSKWPQSEEPNEAAYNLAHHTNATMFGDIATDAGRNKRYADAMQYMSNGPGLEHHHIVHNYDWASLGSGVIVDVGGSYGSLSMAIAREHPLLRFIVQDRPEVVTKAVNRLPVEFEGRISFMEHDIFMEQPIKDADVYVLRWILHDWSDKYAMQILQRLTPALKVGARVLILEQVLPAPNTISKYQEKLYR
ncbi:MAG: hypothetical protein Q9174_001529 [Haloplaca sp. 1 TL-2023]